jgi:transposase
VKPYVKRQKNDAADAEAICEAVTRANMRFVATKTASAGNGRFPAGRERTESRGHGPARAAGAEDEGEVGV